MAWYKVTLTTEQIEQERALIDIEHQFEKIYIEADGPSDMALFSDNQYSAGTVSIYFSPGCDPSCNHIITQYKGRNVKLPISKQSSC